MRRMHDGAAAEAAVGQLNGHLRGMLAQLGDGAAAEGERARRVADGEQRNCIFEWLIRA